MTGTTRMLRRGELLPKFTPTRRIDHSGYVRLSWTIAPNTYVIVYEHRVERDELLGDYVTYAHFVKHKNGNRADNSPDNLEFIYLDTPDRRRVRTV